MITLIHGEDIASSRKKLQGEKERLPLAEKITLNGSKLLLADLVFACQTDSFFSTQKIIIIENLLGAKIDKEKQEILRYLGSDAYRADIILWEDKEVQKTTIKKYFTSVKEFLCQPSKLLFRFLENIGNFSPSQLIVSFHNLLEQEEVEFIFAMLLRQWRYLIMVKDTKSGLKGQLPVWQEHKLKRQASFFSLSQLINFYRILLSLDYKVKTGTTSFNLVALLDIFFLNL